MNLTSLNLASLAILGCNNYNTEKNNQLYYLKIKYKIDKIVLMDGDEAGQKANETI